MTKAAAVLGVHLVSPDGVPVRAGILMRDVDGATAFVADEAYLRDPVSPILSLSWYVPGREEETQARLADRRGKIGLNGQLPPWFAGLLPEGALRELVLAEMGAGDHDQFDVLVRLGADLPGAVLILPETAVPASAGPVIPTPAASGLAAQPEGLVKFSLAGVQLKFAAEVVGERLTAPARAGEGRYILKVPSDRFQALPEAEYAAMMLCRALGLTTAECRLVPTGEIGGVPKAFLEEGPTALLVERFDRPPGGGRIHMEDAAQIIGAVGERKYTMANGETVLNMIARFSTDWRADVLEGIGRLVADVLIGNGDSHLKNWSFVFPGDGEVRLSPAYDIVPTVLYLPADTLALEFAGSRAFETVSLHRFRRVAKFLRLEPDWIEAHVRRLVERALETWPQALEGLLDAPRRDVLLRRLPTLGLVREVEGR